MKRIGLLIGVMLMAGLTIQGSAQAPKGRIEVIAHRGASFYAPENTLASFKLAATLKADWFELDCVLSKDGELVILHDNTLDRTTNGKGWPVDYTLPELKKLDAGSWMSGGFAGEKLPTLREALELAKREKIGCYIEIKDVNVKRKAAKGENKNLDKPLETKLLAMAGDRVVTKDGEFSRQVMQAIEEFKTPNLELTRKVIALVRELGVQQQVVIQSFSAVSCGVTRIEAPEMRVGLLADPKNEAAWNTFLRFTKMFDVQECNLSNKSTSAERLKTVHDQGRVSAVWTVDDPAEIRRQVEMGADKIITNRPDVTLDTLRSMRRR